jgi:hypothetical protein
LSGANVDLRAQRRHVLAELLGGGLAAGTQRRLDGRLGLADPARAVVGDAGALQQRGEALALARHERARRGRLDDRDEVNRHDEHRAPHPEDPHERALLVERVLDRLHRRCGEARAGGEKDRRRVGRVQAAERPGERRRVGEARRRHEAVAQGKSRAALVVPDRPHRREPTAFPRAHAESAGRRCRCGARRCAGPRRCS